MSLRLRVDGRDVEVEGDTCSLLEVLRDRLGLRAAKDGCSPQGQCGCCTVLVDGVPRVACVTPVRRVAGREVTTLDGLDPATRARWADAFVEAGASQCGFCTPGIIMRLAGLEGGGVEVDTALLAHLCRCTGWRTIAEAAGRAAAQPERGRAAAPRDLDAAARRAGLEGGTPQRVGVDVVLGKGGFADDSAPADALVAVPDGRGGWAVGETLSEARAAAAGTGKSPGRRSGAALRHPIEVPPGEWDAVLRTTWVEPAYVETDSSWCLPGGQPASPLGNGGAFGGKVASIAPGAARQLADRWGRAVRVLLSRDDTVRMGPKRPPVAGGVRADGSGVLRVARTEGIAAAVGRVAPGLVVEEVDVAGPPTSAALRAAGWAEAAILLSAAAATGPGPVTITSPAGATASAEVDVDGAGLPVAVRVRVDCGAPLDEVVLRSYAIGAAHMGLGWVCSEAIAVDDDGVPQDLTVRSFGIMRARDTPPVSVAVDGSERPPVNGSDAVFCAVAAAVWRAQGWPGQWPTARGRFPS